MQASSATFEYIRKAPDLQRVMQPDIYLFLVDVHMTRTQLQSLVRTLGAIFRDINAQHTALMEWHQQMISSQVVAGAQSLPTPPAPRFGLLVFGRHLALYDVAQDAMASANVCSAARSPEAADLDYLFGDKQELGLGCGTEGAQVTNSRPRYAHKR